MRSAWTRFRSTLAAVVVVAAFALPASAAEVTVVSSGGFAAALKVLAPRYESMTGNHLILEYGPSMGATKDAVPQRLARSEPIDVVIMVGYALDDLVKSGKVFADSRVDLARSGIGVVVKAGAPRPDVSTVEGLRKALLAAKSVAYSDSASGVYIKNEMFKKMGIEAEMATKAKMIPAIPVGSVVANGEYEIGFQQISELKPITGIELAGPLPPELQKITVFSAGIVAGSKEEKASRSLLDYLSSKDAAATIVASGLEPFSKLGK